MFNFISLIKYSLHKPCNIKKFLCRLRGHPNGVWWYNLHGSEPDMRCKDCDDDLG